MATTFQQRLQMKRMVVMWSKLQLYKNDVAIYYEWLKRFDWDGY